jgi:hypothetical protein
MESLLYYVIVFVFGFISGWMLRETIAVHRIRNMINEMDDDDSEDPELIKISIEKVDSTFFVYNLEDNSFMAQGNTRNELEEALKSRFPGVVFACPEANLKEVGFK